MAAMKQREKEKIINKNIQIQIAKQQLVSVFLLLFHNHDFGKQSYPRRLRAWHDKVN